MSWDILRLAETDLCLPDPRYEEEVSGCTASTAIVSSKQIFVVCLHTSTFAKSAYKIREMLEIREVF